MSRHAVISRSRRRLDPEHTDPEWEEPPFVEPSLPEELEAPEPTPVGLRAVGEGGEESEAPASPPAPSVEPLSDAQLALLALFRDRPDLCFPGVDAASLEARAQVTRALAVEVDRARAALSAAEATLRRDQAELATLYEQAYGYADVFARGNDGLREALSGIVLRPEAPEKRRKKGSRKRARPEADTAELPFAAEA